MDVGYKVNDIFRAGVGLSYTEFSWYEGVTDFDSSIGGFVVLNFFERNGYGLYAKSGLSFHLFGHDHYEPASLLNIDAGAGASMRVSHNMKAGFEYLYSTSVIEGEEKGKKYGDRVKGVKENRHDYSIYLTFTYE
ncbi:MAG: hypothetical protein M3Q07_12170 [Pseudobdellovibrionaceae bacterium]|nr:hypothetical protein [Pseudobdellovibrionaceae bacterium]